MVNHKGFVFYPDGASRGNPGNRGVGIALYDTDGDIHTTAKNFSAHIPIITQNKKH